MRQARLLSYQLAGIRPLRDDIQVELAIRNVPGFLVKEFAEKIAKPYYNGEISEAIRDLMWQAVQTHKLESHL